MDKKPTLIKRANSKLPLRTYSWSNYQASVYPQFSFAACREMVDKDPVARGALNHFVDKCMEGDWIIVNREDWSFDENFQDLLQKRHNFRTRILRPIFLLGALFNNVFVEIVRNSDGSLKDLNVLDTSQLDVKTLPNGDLVEIKSTVPNPKTGEYPTWQPADIVWLKFNDRSEGYAPVDLQALWETLLLKDYMRQYVSWLWKTGQYRILYNFEAASDLDIESFISAAKRADGNFQTPLLTRGKLGVQQVRDIKEIDQIDKLFKYLDQQIAMAMRVPPVDIGMPDTSGRSNADAQSNNLTTRIYSVKTIVADYINNELFPKINKGNTMLRFGPVDRFAEKQILDNLQIMKVIGLSEDAMKEYLIDKGMIFGVKEWFVPQVNPSDIKNPRAIDTAPSRTGKAPGTGNQAQDTPTTRPDQLKKV